MFMNFYKSQGNGGKLLACSNSSYKTFEAALAAAKRTEKAHGTHTGHVIIMDVQRKVRPAELKSKSKPKVTVQKTTQKEAPARWNRSLGTWL